MACTASSHTQSGRADRQAGEQPYHQPPPVLASTAAAGGQWDYMTLSDSDSSVFSLALASPPCSAVPGPQLGRAAPGVPSHFRIRKLSVM